MREPQTAERRSVRWRRLNAGWTANELAAVADVSRGTLLRIEHGERSVLFGHEAERRVAHALGVAPEAIAWGEPGDVGEGTADLAREREARGLTVREVAGAAQVPYATVVRAEAGAAIHPRYAKRLADLFGLAVTDWYPAPAARETAA